MTAKRFLLATFVYLVTLCAVYFLAVDTVAIAQRDIEKYYKPFLLQASQDIQHKIIIDAGSNASHGIRSALLEDYFGRYTINLADKADYPLLHKLYRMKPYLREGDTVILPLEWNFYLDAGRISQEYVSLILAEDGSGGMYYKQLPLIERIRFVYRHVPFLLAVERMLNLNAFPGFNNKLRSGSVNALTDFSHRILARDRADFNLAKKNIFGLYGTRSMSCDDYLLSRFTEDGYDMAPAFARDLQVLGMLANETGARFIFTWPNVVDLHGDDCYRSAAAAKKLPALVATLKREIAKAGLEIVGSIEESRFDHDCFWDTYYHVDHVKQECAPQRTRTLIGNLESVGIKRRAGYAPDTIDQTLLSYVRKYQPLLSAEMPPVNQYLDGDAINRYLKFFDGWSNAEAWGRWSMGNRSIIGVPVHGLDIRGVRVSGRYFDGLEETAVWINKQFVGNVILEDHTFEITEQMRNDVIIEIELRHSNPVSPLKLGLSADSRDIKFGLTGLTLYDKAGFAGSEDQQAEHRPGAAPD